MRCNICHKPIVSSYLTFNGQNIHSDCFRCNKCGSTIKGAYMENLGKYYHPVCYQNMFGLKCNICGNYLNGEYIIDDQGNKAHKIHNGIYTILCQTCGILTQDNKLKLCNSCTSEIVNNKQQIDKCLLNVITQFKKVGILLNTTQTKIDIVEKNTLSENQMGLAKTSMTSFMGQKKFKHNIYIIDNLPKIQFEGVLAHELLHTWLNEYEIKLSEPQTEGFCNIGSYLIYEKSTSSKAKYGIKMLINDPSPIYGVGFRKMKNVLDNVGWSELIKLIKSGHIPKNLETVSFTKSNTNFKINEMKIQVTSPCYDNIGQVLDVMKIPYEAYNVNNKINCDILFMNCGSSDSIPSNEVVDFVAEGGILYASDLMSSFINETFPNIFDFYNSGNPSTIPAKIEDDRIIEYLGNDIDIHFDMGGWAMLKKISKGFVLISRLDNGDPLMVEVPYKKGTIFYTSFHNNAQASEKEITLLKILILKQISIKDKTSIKEVADKLNVDLGMSSNPVKLKQQNKSLKKETKKPNIDDFNFDFGKKSEVSIPKTNKPNIDDFNF